MAEEQITLKVNIETNGTQQLKDLTASLEQLKSISASGSLSGLTNSLTGLSDAVSNLSKNQGSFKNLNKSISSLMRGLSRFDAKNYTNGLNNAAEVLGKAGDAASKFSNSADGLSGTADAFKEIPKSLEGMAKADVAGNLSQTADVLDNLGKATEGAAKNGTKIHNLATGLAKLPEALKGVSDFTQLDDYSSRMSNVGSLISDLDAKVSIFSKKGAAGANSIGKMADSFKEFAKLSNDDYTANVTAGMENAVYATKEFATNLTNAIPDDVLSKFSTLADAVDKITRGMAKFASASKAASKATAGAGASSKAMSVMNGIQSAVNGTIGGISGFINDVGITGAINSITSALSEASPIMGEFVQIGTTGFRDLFASISKAKNPVDAISKGLYSASVSGTKFALAIATMPLKKIASGLKEAVYQANNLSRIMLMSVLYSTVFGGLRLITEGLKTGITNMYEWARVAGDPFKATMDSLATSLQYLHNSVAAAAAPFLDVLAPAIEEVTAVIARFLNMIAQLAAALTGKSFFRKAVRSQKEFAEATNTAAGSSKKQNDELKKTILAFDELNVLQKPNEKTGGGGGGAATPDYSGMFEEAPVDDYFKNLANTDDWTQLGKDIADKINHLMDGIDWDKINSTAQKWSKRIWTAFNGAISELNWAKLGQTIGNGINTVLRFFDDIAQNTHWVELGRNLATALNNVVSTVDWNLIGRSLTDGLKIAFELLHGFMQEFNWDDLRTGITTAIKAAFENIDLTTAAIDISNLAHQILLTIDAAIKAVPWDEIGDALEAVNWTQIFTDILTVMKDLFLGLVESHISTVLFPAIGAKIGGAIGGLVGHPVIGTAIGILVGWIVSEIAQIFIDPDKIEEIKTKISDMFGKAIQKVKDDPAIIFAITALAGVVTLLALAIGKVGKNAGDAGPKTSQFSTTMNGMIKLGAGILMIGAGFALIAEGCKKIADAGGGAIASLAIMSGTLITVTALVGAMGPAISAATPGLLSLSLFFAAVGAAVALVVTAIKDLIVAIADCSGPLSDLISTINQGIVDIINAIADGIVKINNSLPTAADGFSKLASSVKDLVVGTNLADLVFTLGAMAGSIKKIGKQADKMQKAADAIGDFADGLKVFNEESGSASDNFDTLKDKIKNLSKTKDDLGKLKDTVSDTISGMSKAFKNAKFELPKVKSSDFTSSLTSANTSAEKQLSTLKTRFTNAQFPLNKVNTRNFDISLTNAGNNLSTKLSSMKTAVNNAKFTMNSVDYSKATASLDKAYSALNSHLTKIKNLFSKSLSIKFNNWVTVPSFSLSGKFDAKNNKVPSVNATSKNIRWYADAMNEGLILNNATIFGAANGRLLGGGETGQEAVVGTASLRNMIESAVSEALSVNGGGNQAPQVDVQIVADGEIIYRLSQKGKQSIDNRYHVAGAM